MRVLFYLYWALFWSLTTSAVAAPEPLCANFDGRVTAPMRPPPPASPGKVVEESGIRGKGEDAVSWAGARGWIALSPRDATDWILDHTRWKDMEKTKLEVKELRHPKYEAFHVLSQDTKVFAFVRIQWVEEWAYAVLAGTLQAPKHLLTTYQKTAGTSHIRRLCGSVEFRANGIGTDAYFYQEARANHYEMEHIIDLHRRFLATLGANGSNLQTR